MVLRASTGFSKNYYLDFLSILEGLFVILGHIFIKKYTWPRENQCTNLICYFHFEADDFHDL